MRVFQSAIVFAAAAAVLTATGVSAANDPQRTGATYQACDDLNGDGGSTTDDVFNCLFLNGLPTKVDGTGITWVAAGVSTTAATQAECQLNYAPGAWIGDFNMKTGVKTTNIKPFCTGGAVNAAHGVQAVNIKDLLVFNSAVESGFSLVSSFPAAAADGTYGYCTTVVDALTNIAACTHAHCCTAHVATSGPFDDETAFPFKSFTDAVGIAPVVAASPFLPVSTEYIHARALDFSDCIGKASGATCLATCKLGSVAVSPGITMTLYVDKNGKIVLPGLHYADLTAVTEGQMTFPLNSVDNFKNNRAILSSFSAAGQTGTALLGDSNSGMAGQCSLYSCNTAKAVNGTVGFDYGAVGVRQTANYVGNVGLGNGGNPATGATSFMRMQFDGAATRTLAVQAQAGRLNPFSATPDDIADVAETVVGGIRTEGGFASDSWQSYPEEYGPCTSFLWQSSVVGDLLRVIRNGGGVGGAGAGNSDTAQTRVIQGYKVPDPTTYGLGPFGGDFTFVCDSSGAFDGTVNFACTPNTVKMVGTANEVNTPAAQGQIYLAQGVQAKSSLGGVDFAPCEGLTTGATCMPTCKLGYSQSTSDSDGFRVVADKDGVLYVSNMITALASTAMAANANGAVLHATGTVAGVNGIDNCFMDAEADNELCSATNNVRRATANSVNTIANEFHSQVLGSTYAQLMTLKCVPNKCWKGPDAATRAAYPGVNWWLDGNLGGGGAAGVEDPGETYQSVLDALSVGLTAPVQEVTLKSFFNDATGAGGITADTNWGISRTNPCLKGYSLKAGAVVPALTIGLDEPNNCGSNNQFTVTGIANICQANTATEFYTALNTKATGYTEKDVVGKNIGKEVFGSQGFATWYAETRIGEGTAAYCKGVACFTVGNAAVTDGNQHFNGKDYSGCAGLTSGQVCKPVCMAGFSETSSANLGFVAEVNSLGQMLVGKQDFLSIPDETGVANTFNPTGATNTVGGADGYTGCKTYANAAGPCSLWDNRNAVRSTDNTDILATTAASTESAANGRYEADDTLGCTAHVCDAAKVVNGGDFTTYFSCDGMTSMSSCTVDCGPGRMSVPTEGVFTGRGNYYATPQPTSDQDRNYAAGYTKGTSFPASVAITQKFGQTSTTLTDNKVLLCNNDGSFDAFNAFTCVPNTCDFTKVNDPRTALQGNVGGVDGVGDYVVDGGFDFSSCAGMMTNDTCVPTCKTGYSETVTPLIPADLHQRVLSCNAAGTLDQVGEDVTTDTSSAAALGKYLECTPQPCTQEDEDASNPTAAYGACSTDEEWSFYKKPAGAVTVAGAVLTIVKATVGYATGSPADLAASLPFVDGSTMVSITNNDDGRTQTHYCVKNVAGANFNFNLFTAVFDANGKCITTAGTAGFTVDGTPQNSAAHTYVVATGAPAAGTSAWSFQFHGVGCVKYDASNVASNAACSTGSSCKLSDGAGTYCGTNGLMTAATSSLGDYNFPLTCEPATTDIGKGIVNGEFSDPDPTARACAAHVCNEGMASYTNLVLVNSASDTINFKDACNGKANGEQCAFACKTGYGTVIAGDPFVLDYNAQPTPTLQTAMAWCVAADNSETLFDAQAAPGALHFVRSKTGAVLNGAGADLTFNFVGTIAATDTWDTPAGVDNTKLTGVNGKSIWPVCQHGICDADNVGTPIPGIDYSKCVPQLTGSTCTYKCLTGWKKDMTDSSVSMNCDANGDFTDTNFGKDGDNGCAINTCQEVKVSDASSNPNIDYSSCNGKLSGQTCTPSCKTGYSPITPASETTLVCGLEASPSDGNWVSEAAGAAYKMRFGDNAMTFQYSGANTLTCGRTCSFGASDLATTTDNANYASCVGLGNGATCTPTCATGYFASTAATGFTLNCLSLFPAAPAVAQPYSATDPTLVCSVGAAPAATAAPAAPAATAAPANPAASTAAPANPAAPAVTAAPASAGNGKAAKTSSTSLQHDHNGDGVVDASDHATSAGTGKAGKAPAAAPAAAAAPGKAAKDAKATKATKGAKVAKDAKTTQRHTGSSKAGKATKESKASKAPKAPKAGKVAKDAKASKGETSKAGKGAKSALASKAATGATARKPVAYAASGVAVVVVLAAVVALATKHGLGPLSSAAGDVEEGHPLNAPGVHPVYA